MRGRDDTETGRAQLYVDGRAAGAPAQASPAVATGAFQLGRALNGSRYGHHWRGDIGGVQVHDRVVVAGEVTRLAHRQPKPLAHWSLETATDGATPGSGTAHRCGSPPEPPFTGGPTAPASPTSTPTARSCRTRWSETVI